MLLPQFHCLWVKVMGFMRILMVVFERFPSRGWSVSKFNSRPAKLCDRKKYTLTDTTLIKRSSLSQDLRESKKWTKPENPEKTMYVPNRGGGSCSLFYRYKMVSLTPRVHINCWALTSDPQVYKIRGLTTNLAKLLTIHIMMSMKLGALTHLFKSFETVSKTFPLSSPHK